MGNIQSTRESSGWPCVGRTDDVRKAKELLKNKKSILIHGINKIGKTKFLEELIKDINNDKYYRGHYMLLQQDFNSFYADYSNWLYEIFSKLLYMLDATDIKQQFEQKFPNQRLGCGCVHCRGNGKICERQDALLKETINTTINFLKKCDKKFILFIDHVDKIMDSQLKDYFLSFHRDSIKCEALKTVIVSSNKPKQTQRGYGTYELKQLEACDIEKLIYITTELRDAELDDSDTDIVVQYGPKHLVFKEENKRLMEAIVGLCEGLSQAAEMTGLLLTEDDGFITPADLVEILICLRLSCLSPENCPPEDRLDILTKQLEPLNDLKSFLSALNRSMSGCEFTIEEAVTAAGEDKTVAMVKFNYLKKALDRSIISMSDKDRLNWHGIIRECQAALCALEHMPEAKHAKEMVVKFMKDNVKRAGLDIDDQILKDPKKLEQCIRGLTVKEKEVPPVQDTKDPDSDDIRLNLLDDDRLATQKRHSDEKVANILTNGDDIRHTPMAHTSADVEFENKDPNPVNGFERQQSEIKVQTRYSPVEENSASGSDRNRLTFINEGHGVIKGDVPPPYSSMPENHQRNAMLANAYVNEDPPPVYTSQSPSLTSLNSVPAVLSQNPELVEHNSDPSHYIHPRPENDPSLGDSVIGQPALPYNPSSLANLDSDISNELPTSTHRQNDSSHEHVARMDDLKDDLPETFEGNSLHSIETTFVDHPIQGQHELSQRADLQQSKSRTAVVSPFIRGN